MKKSLIFGILFLLGPIAPAIALPPLPDSTVTTSGRFRIHYDLFSGTSHSVDSAYIDQLKDALENAWNHYSTLYPYPINPEKQNFFAQLALSEDEKPDTIDVYVHADSAPLAGADGAMQGEHVSNKFGTTWYGINFNIHIRKSRQWNSSPARKDQSHSLARTLSCFSGSVLRLSIVGRDAASLVA